MAVQKVTASAAQFVEALESLKHFKGRALVVTMREDGLLDVQGPEHIVRAFNELRRDTSKHKHEMWMRDDKQRRVQLRMEADELQRKCERSGR